MSFPALNHSLGVTSYNNINTPPKSLASHNDYKSNSLPNKFLCQVCNDPTLYCCNDCKTVFYCTPEHQIQHWYRPFYIAIASFSKRNSTHQFECKGPEPIQFIQLTQSIQNPPMIRAFSRIDESPRKSPVLDRDRGSARDGFFEEIKRKDLLRRTTERSSENKMTISTPQQRQSTANRNSTPPKERNEGVFVVKEGLEPEYNSNMEPQEENAGPVKNKLKRERVRKLKEVLKYYMKGQYDEATIKAKRLFEVSKEIFETEEDADVYEVLADGLLLVKCLLPEGNITLAREYLRELWEIATHFVSDQRIDFKEDNANMTKLGFAHLRKGASNFVERDALSLAKKREINQQIQKITNLYGTFGALFHEVGDFRSCEASYVKYLKIVENNFGAESLEISNCFYLLGVFYLEQKYYTKAMACFKKSLKTRLKKFEEKSHETIADCYYNMAVIYKQTERDLKAINSLNTALKMRISLVGEFSLPVAQALELAGKISLDQEDYKAALSKLQSCLNIRTRILHDQSNEDITRVKLILQDLIRSVTEKLSNDKTSFVKKENLRQIMAEIQSKNLQEELRIPSLHDQRDRTSSASAKPSIRLDTKSEEEDYYIRTPKIRVNTSSIRQDSKEYASAYPSKSEISESRPVIRSPKITFSPPKVVITSPNNISRLNLQSELRPTMTPKDDPSPITLAKIDEPKSPSPQLKSQNSFKLDNRNVLKPPEEEFVDRSKRFTFGKGDDIETANAYAKNRKSLGQSAKPQIRRLNLPEDFLDSLTGGQLELLNELNVAIRGKKEEKMDSLVAQSDFYRSLLTPQKSQFIKLNPELVL